MKQNKKKLKVSDNKINIIISLLIAVLASVLAFFMGKCSTEDAIYDQIDEYNKKEQNISYLKTVIIKETIEKYNQDNGIIKPPYVIFYESKKKSTDKSWDKLSIIEQKEEFKNFISDKFFQKEFTQEKEQ